MKQTAIEWLLEQCPRIETVSAYNILEQAKVPFLRIKILFF